MESDHELIISIVNSGFADHAMDAARGAGARGGTIISGRGTARKEAEEKLGITVHPEKDIIFIIVSKDQKEAILKALYESSGISSDAQGFSFSLPVDEVAGMK